MLFSDKVVLVTGGASGIGRAACQRYAQEGAKVLVADINETEALETVRLIEEAGGEAAFFQADMTKPKDIEAMIGDAMGRWGRLDVAFNNAATTGLYTNAVDCTEEEFDFVVNLNLKSVWLCMKFEIPAMIASGGGAIVNTASGAALHPTPHMLSYVTTKAGVVGMTKSVARDFADRGIRANVLLPGMVDTPMLAGGRQGLRESLDIIAGSLPMQRISRPDEQADVAVWLSSAQSSYVTGIALSADGGKDLV